MLGQVGRGLVVAADVSLADAERLGDERLDLDAESRGQVGVREHALRDVGPGSGNDGVTRGAHGWSHVRDLAGERAASDARGVPVEPRVTSRTGSGRECCDGGAGSPARSRASRRAARAPSSRAGTAIVVSSGVTSCAKSMSSQPTMEMSPGMAMPACAHALYAPSAIRSFAQK